MPASTNTRPCLTVAGRPLRKPSRSSEKSSGIGDKLEAGQLASEGPAVLSAEGLGRLRIERDEAGYRPNDRIRDLEPAIEQKTGPPSFVFPRMELQRSAIRRAYVFFQHHLVHSRTVTQQNFRSGG